MKNSGILNKFHVTNQYVGNAPYRILWWDRHCAKTIFFRITCHSETLSSFHTKFNVSKSRNERKRARIEIKNFNYTPSNMALRDVSSPKNTQRQTKAEKG